MGKELLFRYDSLRGTDDDDYIFYDDGTIVHEYDRGLYKTNQVENILPEHIRPSKIKEIIENCPADKKDRIKQILGQ